MSDKKKLIGIYGFVFIFYLVMGMLTPLTHDDQMWALQYGDDLLANWFDNYNGRYVGNILEMMITRSYFLRIIVFAVCNSGIVILVSELVTTRKYRMLTAIFSFSLMLLIPVSIYKQTFGWMAGFANYNTSIFLTLLFLYILKKTINSSYEKSVILHIVILILAFSSQLFVEHLTVYNLLLSIFILIVSKLKYGKTSKLNLTYLIGLILGAVVMFTNSAYASIFAGADSVNYREVNLGIQLFSQAWQVYRRDMYRLLVMNNLMLNLILSLLMIIYLLKKDNLSQRLTWLRGAIILYLTAFALYGLIIKNQMNFTLPGHESGLALLESLMTIVYLLVICLSFIFFETNKQLRLELIFYGVSAVLVAAPLVVVTPFGPRCFLASYVFFVLLTSKLFVNITEGIKNTLATKIKIPLLGVVLVIVSIYVLIFAHITIANQRRVAHIRAEVAADAKVIKIIKLPHEQFLHNSSPQKGVSHEKIYKEYYGIPLTTEIEFVSPS